MKLHLFMVKWHKCCFWDIASLPIWQIFAKELTKDIRINITGVKTQFRGFPCATTDTILRLVEKPLASSIKYVYLQIGENDLLNDFCNSIADKMHRICNILLQKCIRKVLVGAGLPCKKSRGIIINEYHAKKRMLNKK
ncbi:hypothetical protein CHS0354_016686 [Potamilus streckersoni]|uniref:Uncharacterized protein n=1 Tax=Potamilus streckersoni TaxID=2493646 RepID=A0AAE0THM7_9BIVA|nr:hypothetical protein CHS0354_016686 [Potamilus streckersoni]